MNENIIFLNNYLEKELIILDESKTKNEIINEMKVNSKNILCEGEELKEGDFALINNKIDYIYIVKPNDTLESISNRFGVGIEEIKRKNNIKIIFNGQQLYI